MPPIVSIVIPICNVEGYLRGCLDCAVEQTLRDIEIICVDDGSTDGSAAIVDEYAARDPRVLAIHQPNAGAGAARNRGMALARGKYLYFPDADDRFSVQLLEKAVSAAEAHLADVVVFRMRRIDELNDGEARSEFRFRKAVTGLPQVFSWRDCPDVILDSFRTSVWNKLYRASFVRAQKLTFQEIVRSNDLLFAELSLVSASRIFLLDEVLYDYLIRTTGSLQATYAETPMTFVEAWRELKAELEGRGIFKAVRPGFVSYFWADSLKMLENASSHEIFARVYSELKGGIFAAFGIGPEDAECMKSERKRLAFEILWTSGQDEFHVRYLKAMAQMREKLADANSRRKTEIAQLKETRDRCKAEIVQLKETRTRYKAEIAQLKEERRNLKESNRSLKEANLGLKEDRRILKSRIKELERRPHSIRGCAKFIFRRLRERVFGRRSEC